MYQIISVDLYKYMYETFNKLEGADMRIEQEDLDYTSAKNEAERLSNLARMNERSNRKEFNNSTQRFYMWRETPAAEENE